MRSIHLLLTCAALSLAAGCQQSRKSTANAEGEGGVFHRAEEHHVSTREYRVDPPDEIVVKAPNIKELDNQRQIVRPDGKISLNLLGEVYVAGMTPVEINRLLNKLTEKYYSNNPDVKVEVIAKSKFYYVFGFGAQQAGKYAYTGRDTVITALAEAGFGERGWPQEVLVSRPPRGDRKEPATAVVDFTKIWGYGDLSQNYLLEEGDIIEVRNSPLAEWNWKMERILGPISGTSGVVTSSTAVVPARGGQ